MGEHVSQEPQSVSWGEEKLRVWKNYTTKDVSSKKKNLRNSIPTLAFLPPQIVFAACIA